MQVVIDILVAASQHPLQGTVFRGPACLLLPDDGQEGMSTVQPDVGTPAMISSSVMTDTARSRCTGPVAHVALEARHGCCMVLPEALASTVACVQEALQDMLPML